MREEKKKKRGRVPFFSSIQMKYAMSYLAIVSVVLILLNTYPVLASQDLLFGSKRDSLKSQAAVMASALMELELLTSDQVERVMTMLDSSGLTRVVVTDPAGLILYDSTQPREKRGETAETAPVQEEPGALEPVTAGNAEELLDKLTTEQKVGQLFFVRPEALDPNRTLEEAEDPAGPGVTQADPALQNSLQQYPVGGFVLFGKNLESPDQLSQLMDTLSRNAAVPLLFSVEEEGGAATQVAGRPGFSVPTLESLADIGATGDPAQAKAAMLAAIQQVQAHG